MATVIRLKRGGRTHAPCYRVVVMDSRARARGREIDIIGYYHPCAKPEAVVEVNEEKARDWLAKGAQTSETVRSILSSKGIIAAHANQASVTESSPSESSEGEGSEQKAGDVEDASSEAAAAE